MAIDIKDVVAGGVYAAGKSGKVTLRVIKIGQGLKPMGISSRTRQDTWVLYVRRGVVDEKIERDWMKTFLKRASRLICVEGHVCSAEKSLCKP
jgi:hypothetical protein